MRPFSIKILLVGGLISSASILYAASFLADSEYLDELGKRAIPKPPSPLLNAARSGSITPLQKHLLDPKIDPHEWYEGELVCVQACKQSKLPRQVSATALFLLHGHGGCGTSDGCKLTDLPITQEAQKKIKGYIADSLRGEMPDVVVMIVVHYFAPTARKKKLAASRCSSFDEPSSESPLEKNPT